MEFVKGSGMMRHLIVWLHLFCYCATLSFGFPARYPIDGSNDLGSAGAQQRQQRQQSKRAEPPRRFEEQLEASAAGISLATFLASGNVKQIMESQNGYLDGWFEEAMRQVLEDPELHACADENVSHDGCVWTFCCYLPV